MKISEEGMNALRAIHLQRDDAARVLGVAVLDMASTKDTLWYPPRARMWHMGWWGRVRAVYSLIRQAQILVANLNKEQLALGEALLREAGVDPSRHEYHISLQTGDVTEMRVN